MPVITGVIRAEGAMVPVLIGWSNRRALQLRLALKPVPQPVRSRGILDSGAEQTCVDLAFVRSLGLPFRGVSLINLPAHGGTAIASITDASLTILHPSGNPRDHFVLRHLPVLELSLAPTGYDVLIGRDVLAKLRFQYNGPRNRFRLIY
jgi:hypothetical protein